MTDTVVAAGATAVATQPELYCVLISGKMHSGKTTTQEALESELRDLMESDTVGVEMGNFATALKVYCAREAKVPIGLFYSEEGKNTHIDSVGMTARQYLQHIGESKRLEDPNVWIKELRRISHENIRSGSLKTLILIVGDCRHPNEIELMRPGMAVRLIGNPANMPVSADVAAHISETALDGFADFDMYLDTDSLGPQQVIDNILGGLVRREPVLFEKLKRSRHFDVTGALVK